VIIIGLDGERIEMATYGKTRALCARTNLLGKAAFDAVMECLP